MLAEVGACGRDEVLLAHAVADALGPAVELGLEPVEVRTDVLVHAEVDQRQPLGLAAAHLPDRLVPALDRDVRRRADGQHVGRARHADAGRVAGEQRAVSQVRDVVRRVPGRRERVPAEDVAVGDAHVLLRHRRELAP